MFESRIHPSLNTLDLDHLVVSGDVTFGENVTLKVCVCVLYACVCVHVVFRVTVNT